MIKNNIKNLRSIRGISSSDLASRAGTDQSMITRLESGERSLTLDWIERLSGALNCEPWELLPIEWQPQTKTIDDQPRLLRILDSVNTALKELKKTAPDKEKMQFVLYLYNEGYAKEYDEVANDNEISPIVKAAFFRVA